MSASGPAVIVTRMFERLDWLRRLQLNVAVAATVVVLIAAAVTLGTAIGDDPAQAVASTAALSSAGR